MEIPCLKSYRTRIHAPPPQSTRYPRHPRAKRVIPAPPPSSSRTRGSMLQCGTNLRKYWIPAFARKTTSKKCGYDKYSPRRPRHPRERGDPCSSVSPTFENTGSPHSRGRRPAKNVGTTSIPRAAPGHPRNPRNPATRAPPPSSSRTRGSMLQCGTNLKKYWIPAFTRKATSKKRGYDKYCHQ